MANFFRDQSTATSILTPDEREHSRLRRAFTKALKQSALAAQQPILAHHTDNFVERIGADQKPTTNIRDLYSTFAFGFMSDLMFGRPLNLRDEKSDAAWVHSLWGYTKAIAILASLAKFTMFKLIFRIVGLFARPFYYDFLSLTALKLDTRLSGATGRNDILHFFQDSDEKTRLSRPELDSAAIVLMFTGSESTPVLLTGLTYLLLKHPESLHRVVHEVRTAFKCSSDITLDTVKSLEYLSACITEALRVYPPAPLGVPRIVPEGGATIATEWIPRKTVVYVPHFVAYGPANFSEAESFIPERWLAECESSYHMDKRGAFQPFGLGPRDCIGKA